MDFRRRSASVGAMTPAAFAALAQFQPVENGPRFPFDPFSALGVVGSAAGTFLLTLVVGALLVAVAPGYTRRLTDRVTAEPVASFLYGLLAVVAVVALTFLLVVTVVGILFAIPLLLVAALAAVVGEALAFLALGRALAAAFWPLPEGADAPGKTEWRRPILLGATVAGVLGLLPVGGGLLAFLVALAGWGAVFRAAVGGDAEGS